jgi:Ca-activated chloride channel homolog
MQTGRHGWSRPVTPPADRAVCTLEWGLLISERMRHARGLTVALALVFVASGSFPAGAAQEPQTPIFRSAVRTVPVYATVVDQNGRLVPGLTEEDFEILDNGKPAPITLFSDEPQPFTAVVMLDTSASMTEHLGLLKRASEQFLIRLLPVDRAQVGAFNDKLQLSGTFTNDRDELIAALDDLQFGNPTRLNDAIAFSLDALQGIEGRRVVLVFSDGEDTFSKLRFGPVQDRARNEEVMVYAIGLEVDYFNGMRRVRSRPDRNLRRIADETGGGYFELKRTDELAPTFTRVSQELRSQYLLGFAPETLDGRVHKLEVRVKKPGMTVRARRSYLAVDE